MQFPHARQLIFSKAPQPGRVKTRLIPELGEEAATELHLRMLQYSVKRVVTDTLCPVQLWCSPTTDHPVFSRLARETGVTLWQQTTGDLGKRMQHGADTALASARYVVLTGTDCPDLDAVYLHSALEKLADGFDAVLGPAEDGGYALLGLRTSSYRLFVDVPWGSDQVLSVTRERLKQLNWRYAELGTLWDVDRPADVARLAAAHPGLLGA